MVYMCVCVCVCVSVYKLDLNSEDDSLPSPWWKGSSVTHPHTHTPLPPNNPQWLPDPSGECCCLEDWGLVSAVGKLGTHCWQEPGWPSWEVLVWNPFIASAAVTVATSSLLRMSWGGWWQRLTDIWRFIYLITEGTLCCGCPLMYIRIGAKHFSHTMIIQRGPSIYFFPDLLLSPLLVLSTLSAPTKPLTIHKASLVAQRVNNPPAMQEILVWFLGWEDPLEKG